MKVALVHDDLVQWGGAERILLGLSEIYPDAPIYTSVYDCTNITLMRNFGTKKIITSFLQKIPAWKKLYKALLPFYGLAFEQFDFTGYDLVISHTTRFAKSIITKPETVHICYCHTPPRFLWHFSGEKNYGLGEFLMSKLRIYDAVVARRVDCFLAGSENARRRIKRAYGVDSKVVYPYVDLERFKGVESFDGGYYLAVGRPNKYKRLDLVIKACNTLGLSLKIAGSSWYEKILGCQYATTPRVSEPRVSEFDDKMVVQIMAGCKALIIAGEEDFGLTSLEAQALGKAVVAYKAGGALETVTHGKTGVLFDEQTEQSLVDALKKLESIKINPDDCRANAAKFSKENFNINFRQTVPDLLYTR